MSENHIGIFLMILGVLVTAGGHVELYSRLLSRKGRPPSSAKEKMVLLFRAPKGAHNYMIWKKDKGLLILHVAGLMMVTMGWIMFRH